jgi:Xaa-Pro aminopeptidase
LSGRDEYLEGFPSQIFARRRERVLGLLEDDAMVLPAAPLLRRSRDAELPYRPDSELYYLSGFPEPGAVLVLRGFADEARTVLFTRPRDPEAELWSGPRLGPDEAGERLGVDEAHPLDELSAVLPGLLKDARRVHFRLGAHPRVEPLVVEALRTARRRGPRHGTGPRAVVDPGEILDELRLRKDPEEVAAIRDAVAATVAGFRAGLETAAPGRGEWEIQAEVEAEFRRRGASGPAFATIAAAGENACILHYVSNAGRVGEEDLVLLDAGAEVRMYAADVTRTFPATGRFTPAQRAVYEVVEAARRRGVDGVRPGATLQGIHREVTAILTEGLVELGLLTGSVEELMEEEAHKAFFPHRTSHWLGMDTHDPGDYVREGRPRPLEPGMVLTIEPGLYFRSGDEADHPYAGIGVRIEDDVLVTPEGGEVLTRQLPTDPDEIAAMVGS